ncbi:MAG TPA: ATP-binding protein, partial [Methylibium sp.]
VLDEQGRAIAGDPGLAAMPVSVAPGGWRLVDTSMEGVPIRMAVRGLECGTRNCQVRMAETRNKREQLNAQVLRGGLALIFGVVVLLAGVVWWVVVKALRPLQALRLQMASRTLDDLPPLDPGRVPAEVYPLVQAINELFERLRAAAQAQQAFIADAAHQLRTPLTALRTETELALLEPHPGELQPTLNRLHNAAERAARVADQLLALARTEAAVRQSRRAEVFDLKILAQQAAQDWVPRALQRGVDLGFQLESARVQGRSYLVRELLANLIHNALEYTPPHAGERARVTVRTRVEPEGFAVLEVEDNGPGIPAEEHELVFERFHRGAGAPGPGSGLGLAIVRDIALAHGARVSLAAADEDGRGLKVKVIWRIAGSKAAQ